MNIFYLRYYISKTIGETIGSFLSIDKEIKHRINIESWRWYLNNRDGDDNNIDGDDNNINKNINNTNSNNTT